MTINPGDKVAWYTRKGLRRTGVVVSTRKTPRTGRAWLQVKVDPCKASTYAGGKSLQPKQLVAG